MLRSLRMGNLFHPTCYNGCNHLYTVGFKLNYDRKGALWQLQPPRGLNTLRPRQNGRHFVDETFKPIFLNENIRISIKILLKFVRKVPINNIPSLIQIMAWRRPGDKPLSEAMMVSLLTHICVTRPQCVKAVGIRSAYTVGSLHSTVSHFIIHSRQLQILNLGKTGGLLETQRNVWAKGCLLLEFCWKYTWIRIPI